MTSSICYVVVLENHYVIATYRKSIIHRKPNVQDTISKKKHPKYKDTFVRSSTRYDK